MFFGKNVIVKQSDVATTKKNHGHELPRNMSIKILAALEIIFQEMLLKMIVLQVQLTI
jgi:hypothetical protein